MNVIAVQSDVVWESPPANFAKLRRRLVNAAPERNSLVALPEMFATGFSMNAAATAEPVGGATEQFLARTAQELGVCLVAGVARRGSDGRARNEALVFSSAGELLTAYTKQRPFSPGGEAEHYTAGEQPVMFRWEDCTVSPFICYDLRFPELFREAVAAHRPELIVVIANWPAKRIQHWTRLLQARAIENQAYVVGVNRVGTDPHYAYCGRSLIIDPHGEILADAGEGEGVIQVKLDLASLRKYREGLPFLADLRWD
ncbi:MAG: carbon-nitrogen family hydrolase [Verrucomicrobiae bacterium]|nr:carbon-nitrogen family hydrolase [Verrucomicrobiae bacterium]